MSETVFGEHDDPVVAISDEAMRCCIQTITQSRGISAVSSVCMALNASLRAMIVMGGGPDAVQYARSVIETMDELIRTQQPYAERRPEQVEAFQRMCDHYDLLMSEAEGSA